MAEEIETTKEITKPRVMVDEGKLTQLIIFNLGDEEFGAEIGQTREIIRMGVITPIPDSPDFIKGVINVRGEIAVVIDLKKRFFLQGKDVEAKHIVMTEQEKNLFGLMVDEVTEVLRIPESEIKDAPELVTRIHEEYVRGVVTIGDRLIILLDFKKVLSEEELEKLSEYSRKHREKEVKKAKHATADYTEKSQITQKTEAAKEPAEQEVETVDIESLRQGPGQAGSKKTATAKGAKK